MTPIGYLERVACGWPSPGAAPSGRRFFTVVAAAPPARQREKVDKSIPMTAPAVPRTATLTKDDYQFGFSDPEQYSYKSRRGLDADVVRQISAHKQEPEWMLQFRLRALDIFLKKPLPTWPSADLSEIDFDNIFYYLRPTDNSA